MNDKDVEADAGRRERTVSTDRELIGALEAQLGDKDIAQRAADAIAYNGSMALDGTNNMKIEYKDLVPGATVVVDEYAGPALGRKVFCFTDSDSVGEESVFHDDSFERSRRYEIVDPKLVMTRFISGGEAPSRLVIQVVPDLKPVVEAGIGRLKAKING